MPVKDANKVQTLLKDIGLAKKEVAIYLHLLEVGASTAGVLAKRTNNSRSTVYSSLDVLLNRGLITVDLRGEAKYFIAEPPTQILEYLDKEIKKTIEQKELVQRLLPSLRNIYQSTNADLPKIRFFVGTNSVERMLYDNHRKWWKGCMGIDGIWWGYQDVDFVIKWREWLEITWKYNTNQPKQARIQILSNLVPNEKELKKRSKELRREIRFVPKSINHFTSTLWIVGDYLIFLYHKDQVDYAIEIHDNTFAGNERAIIKMLWAAAKK